MMFIPALVVAAISVIELMVAGAAETCAEGRVGGMRLRAVLLVDATVSLCAVAGVVAAHVRDRAVRPGLYGIYASARFIVLTAVLFNERNMRCAHGTDGLMAVGFMVWAGLLGIIAYYMLQGTVHVCMAELRDMARAAVAPPDGYREMDVFDGHV